MKKLLKILILSFFVFSNGFAAEGVTNFTIGKGKSKTNIKNIYYKNLHWREYGKIFHIHILNESNKTVDAIKITYLDKYGDVIDTCKIDSVLRVPHIEKIKIPAKTGKEIMDFKCKLSKFTKSVRIQVETEKWYEF